MAITRRGTQQARAWATTTVPSISASFLANVTAGDLVVVGVVDGTYAPGAGAVTDNATTPNTYSVDANGSGLAASAHAAIFSAKNVVAAAATPFTVTYDFGGATFKAIVMSEYTPALVANALDVTAAGGSATANTTYTTATTAVTTQADEVAVAMLANMGTVNQAILTSAPFTEIFSNGNGVTDVTGAMSDRITTATGTQQCTWTSQSAAWDACIAVYKGATAVVTPGLAGSMRPSPFSPGQPPQRF
jgi:hypothetical protein